MSHAAVLVVIPWKKNPEEEISYQMEPFCENDSWFQDGSRWDWWQIGGRFTHLFERDIFKISDFNLESWQEHNRKKYAGWWEEAQSRDQNEDHFEFMTGVKPHESLKDYLARKIVTDVPSVYAFLHERHWHEGERMGWFGMSAATECEIKTGDKPRRCHTIGKDGAHLTTWNEPHDEWSKNFWNRFVKPLDSSLYLAVVDYHV